MPTDMERMIVALEARTKSFENALKKSNRFAQKQLRGIEKQFDTTNKKLSKGLTFGGLAGGLRGGVAGIGGIYAADKVKKYADAWTEAGNKIAAASQVAGRSGRSLDGINKIATETRSGITETVDLYAKLLRSTKDVAKNEQEVATATEIVNKAFKAGGAAASEQAAGVLQLSQALGSGLLQGDELRSIRENAPLIAQAIAKEFKTTIGGLKQLGADGKLTVDRVFQAILKAKPEIDRAYGTTNATIADGATLVNNALAALVGKLSEVSGAGNAVSGFLRDDLAGAITGLSDALDDFKDSAGVKAILNVASAIGKIDSVLTGRNSAQRSAFNANVDKSVLIGGGDTIPNMLAGMENSVIGYKEIKDLGNAFDEFRQSIEEVNPAAAKTLSALQKQLNDGEISAQKAKTALHEMFGTDPMYGRLLKVFDDLLDKLQKVEGLAKATKNGLDLYAPDPRAAGYQMQHDREQSQKFFTDRNADASRTDLQKEIDTRADVIIKAAGKVGVAITEAAAKIQAAKEIAAEDIAKSASKSASLSFDVIKDFEDFRSKPYYDVNAYRAGYGSDTVTLADGSIQKIAKGMSVSVADANRDLVRRIGDFQDGIRKSIGADTFNGMDEKQQAALTSIAYNYGSLPERIVAAIKTGNQATVVQAIRGLGSDNGGINRDRRSTEADLFLGGSPSGVRRTVKGQDRFGNSLEDTQHEIDLLNKQAEALGLVNPLIDDYGYAVTKAEVKQRLLNDAQENGITVTPELAAQIDALAGKYASASAAGEQLQEAQGKLVHSMEQSSAFGKDVLGGFISDLKDGKSASEALAGALEKVGDKLLDIALNSLFDGAKAGSGGGILGGLFSFLFAKDGGVYAHGRKQPMKTFARGGVSRSAAIFGEAGPEAAVPLPDGRRIPVELRNPNMKSGGGSTDMVRVVLQDDSGRMANIADQRIQTASGTIVAVSVQKSSKVSSHALPNRLASQRARGI